MLIVETTQRIQSESHKGIRKMEGIVRKLDRQALPTMKYYYSKQLPKKSKVKTKKIMALNIYRKLICAKQIASITTDR